ncbi:thiamine phosphate synthase [Caldibacillus lycopersici]|uniref:Thiamine-phosphate synthase n=1 Tax=Perspicuibacillus lycopersici TaxID=1325689 RepID=A0AAE3IVY6_9BACI|nr:thiamine phosphate synthase [Perspicuibacillus lycopersici]MCU9614391.1 thiamine phosphate synthase [Perspicuibacillus lycopersici]
MTTTFTDAKLREALKVYFIMGSINCLKSPVEVLTEAICGGITMFQFREKGTNALVGEEKYALAEELQFICKKYKIPFIVNDDIALAQTLKADGVHIGQEDDPIPVVREQIGDKILGVSVHNVEEAKIALQKGADYFGVGPIFPTTTKADAKPASGVAILTELRMKGYSLPIVGIGGITAKNASQVIKAGADGVSVITAISLADNIVHATKVLNEAIIQNDRKN